MFFHLKKAFIGCLFILIEAQSKSLVLNLFKQYDYKQVLSWGVINTFSGTNICYLSAFRQLYKILETVAYKQHKLISHSSGNPRSGCQHGKVRIGPSCKWQISCILTWRKGDRDHSVVSFRRTLISFIVSPLICYCHPIWHQYFNM